MGKLWVLTTDHVGNCGTLEIQYLNIVEILRTEIVKVFYRDVMEILYTDIVEILPKYNDDYCGQNRCSYSLRFCG